MAVVRVTQAYRFALKPTPAQERALRSHAVAARFAWNWGLAKCKDRYEAERNWYSAIDLHKLWNAEKKADPALAWWGENSARNLRDLAASGAESLNACGGTVRPGHAGRVPLKQEPGTASADETGTAARQREAAA